MNANDILAFEAEDVNDPKWDIIIKILKENIEGFDVMYADGNWMNFIIPSEHNKVEDYL